VFGVRGRYAVLFSKGDVRLLEEEVPEPKGNEVLVRVGVCGVCTGDLYAYLGYRVWFSTPARFGHEPAGEVIAVGPNVSGVKPGDRVAALVASGYGCYADYFIAKGDAVAKLPNDLPFEYGIGEPLGAVVNGVRQAAPRAGDSVAVVGAGFMGTLLIQALSRMNLSSLVAVDVRDDRLRLAKEYGATATLNPSNPNFDSEVKELAVSPEAAVHCPLWSSPPSPSRRSPWAPSPQQLPTRRRGFPATTDLGNPGALIKALGLG
jgi:threonine dehydrogenase-like Zn-dependent dehydrogenase